MTAIGTIIDGKYEILTEIGRGGMSVVYLAMDTHLNKQWAVKEIRRTGGGPNDEIIVNSLLAEANMMKRLDHPALPRIVDIIENGTTIYVVMDYIEGESLDKILKEYGIQQEQVVINWAKQLCDALSYLHSQRPPIIYRDMKPANVMLKPEGNIKIIDFGIAREYKEQNLADTTVLGTRGYAPPEQYSSQTDARSDIYALGMTMHHLLTGVDPRAGEAYAPVRMWNPELSEGIEKIIDKCVEPAAENRYQSCQELLYDLEHPELITSNYKKQQKRKLVAFIITMSLAILFGIGGIVTNRIAANMNLNNYDVLIATSTATSLENKIANYKSAIEIFPERTEPYSLILQAYEDEGVFSKKENDEFLALYNANKELLATSGEEYYNLNYKIGMMYFNYYTDEDGTYSYATRVQKAHPFFAENYEAEAAELYTNKEMSDCYYQICSFYKKFILSSATVEEASKSNYEELLNTIRETVVIMDDAGAYDQLLLYNTTVMLLYDQRGSMVQVNVEEDEVLALMDDVAEKADGLVVQKEQSMKLQQEIADCYEDYRGAIRRAYKNKER